MPVGTVLGVLQEIHAKIRVRLVEREVLDKTDLAEHVGMLGIGPSDRGISALFGGLDCLVEQVFVVGGFGSQEEVHLQAL